VNSFSRMLPKVVRESQDSPQAIEFAVFAAWANAAGPATRQVATPVQFDGRTLHVATTDETWRLQLERLSAQFLFKINGTLGSNLVSRIAHRVDSAAVSKASSESPRTVVIPGVQLCEQLLEPDVAAIADPALRAIFLRAAARCLARRTGRPSST
jgi:hypothetical protein